MALIRGRQIKHSEHVDLSSIKSVEPHPEHRQVLKYRYHSRTSKKYATIILMNPSGADKMMADNTIRRVEDITFTIFKDIEYVHIYNLFSVRGKSPSEVNSLYHTKGESELLYPGTDLMLKKSIKKSDICIAAWGGPCGIQKDLHQKRVELTCKLLADAKALYRVAGGHYKKDALYPLHGRLWGYAMKKYKVKADQLSNIKKS